jgi:hypothetical protein
MLGLIPALPNRRDPYVLKWSMIKEHHIGFKNSFIVPRQGLRKIFNQVNLSADEQG